MEHGRQKQFHSQGNLPVHGHGQNGRRRFREGAGASEIGGGSSAQAIGRRLSLSQHKGSKSDETGCGSPQFKLSLMGAGLDRNPGPARRVSGEGRKRILTYALWIVQGLLALLFLFAGGIKLV